jgi:DNA replication and repair protein RecF
MVLALDRTFAARTEMTRQAARLALRRLVLTDFRSWGRVRLEPDPRPVVLTGPNGAGKTNLLEALSLLAPGRGLRGARLAEIDRVGGGGFAVAARLEGPQGPIEIGVGHGQDGERERRLVRIDGVPASSQTALAGHVAVLWLTPAMDRLFQEGPSARRAFLDRLVLAIDDGHAGQVARYSHALRERARLLREGRADPAWLDALEARAAAAGVAIAWARRRLVQGLAAALAEEPGRFPRPALALDGEVEAWLDGMAALEAEERLRAGLAASRHLDGESGTTAIGPHRSDLLVHDAASGRPARDGSTGEQKALLIGIVLADARLRARRDGRLPLLLLDEVAAHLDPARRADLFAELLALGAQAWLTGTDAAIFAPLGRHAQRFAVAAGGLQPDDEP